MQSNTALKALLCVSLFSQGWLYSMDSGTQEENSFFSVLDVIRLRSAENPFILLSFTLSKPQSGGRDVDFLMDFHDAIAIHSVTANGETIRPFPFSLRADTHRATPVSTRSHAAQYLVRMSLLKINEFELAILNQFRSPPLSEGPYFMLHGTVASRWPHIYQFPIPQDAHTIEIIYSGIYQKDDKIHYGTEKYRLLLLDRENAANRDAK